MYSRAYADTKYDGGAKIHQAPKNYNGTMFSPARDSEHEKNGETCDKCEFKKSAEKALEKRDNDTELVKKEDEGAKPPSRSKLDTDDIILLAIAFMVMNGEDDNEALLLLAAIFILGII